MTYTDDNPPAYPRDHRHDGHNGMSLRDYFAVQALPVVTALLGRDVGTADMLARDAYTIADAMLAARATTASKEGE